MADMQGLQAAFRQHGGIRQKFRAVCVCAGMGLLLLGVSGCGAFSGGAEKSRSARATGAAAAKTPVTVLVADELAAAGANPELSGTLQARSPARLAGNLPAGIGASGAEGTNGGVTAGGSDESAISTGMAGVASADGESVAAQTAAATEDPVSQLIETPNPVIQRWKNPLGEKFGASRVVGLRLVEKRFDTNNVYIVISIRNSLEKSIRVRIYGFGYDKNDRLVNTTEEAINLQGYEQTIKSYSYGINSGVTRWVAAVQDFSPPTLNVDVTIKNKK